MNTTKELLETYNIPHNIIDHQCTSVHFGITTPSDIRAIREGQDIPILDSQTLAPLIAEEPMDRARREVIFTELLYPLNKTELFNPIIQTSTIKTPPKDLPVYMFQKYTSWEVKDGILPKGMKFLDPIYDFDFIMDVSIEVQINKINASIIWKLASIIKENTKPFPIAKAISFVDYDSNTGEILGGSIIKDPKILIDNVTEKITSRSRWGNNYFDVSFVIGFNHNDMSFIIP
jgi:hypothetical protein